MAKLPIITLENKNHRNTNQILMHFNYNKTLIDITKKLPGRKWSQNLNCWYIENNPKNLRLIFSSFKGKAFVDSSKLFSKTKKPKIEVKPKVRELSSDNKTLINNFNKYLKGKRLSENTVKSYTYLTADFIAFHNNKPLNKLTNRDVELFIEDTISKRDYSISTQRQFISAIKHFKTFYPDCQINNIELTRPKKSKILPTVLSKMEIINLMRCTKNLKHRAIIGLMYSAGLRVSELINLELKDIYINRRQIHIKNAKGRKDRYIVLSEGFMPLLENYVMSYRPEKYFVEGKNGHKYSGSSIRKFLYNSTKEANIQKRVTPHTLRHSYATHLLENGVGLRHIQELLGHVKPETTMIYTHVAKKDLLDIKSPLDTILLELKNSDKLEQKFLLSGK